MNTQHKTILISIRGGSWLNPFHIMQPVGGYYTSADCYSNVVGFRITLRRAA